MFKCYICHANFSFPDYYNHLKLHEKSNVQRQKILCQINNCPVLLPSVLAYKKHCQRYHSEDLSALSATDVQTVSGNLPVAQNMQTEMDSNSSSGSEMSMIPVGQLVPVSNTNQTPTESCSMMTNLSKEFNDSWDWKISAAKHLLILKEKHKLTEVM